MFRKLIPLNYALLFATVCVAISFLLFSFIDYRIWKPEEIKEHSKRNNENEIKRLPGFTFTNPLLLIEKTSESEKMMPVKKQLEALINGYQMSGTIQNASVYLCQLNQAEWISIGEQEKYLPGSLLKIPELISFYKMNEMEPGLLNKRITYNKAYNLPVEVHFNSKSIELGKTYTIKELLHYMIAYSDNNATMLLNEQMDYGVFQKVFSDLGIPVPDLTKNQLTISASDVSLFLRALYNASYLNSIDSETCIELLSYSDFKIGLIAGLPLNTKTANKYGEAGDGNTSYLNETGIIYIQNSPYLLTVMTKGRDLKLLTKVISNISSTVYTFFN